MKFLENLNLKKSLEMNANKEESFNKRWSIDDESDYDERFKKFKNGVINIFSRVDSILGEKLCEKFCTLNGLEFKIKIFSSLSPGHHTNIIDALKNESQEKLFYRFIQGIFDVVKNNHAITKDYYNYFEKIKEVAEVSGVNLALTMDDTTLEVILHPKGEKKLDKELIDSVFSFLDEKSNGKFKEALIFYEQKKHIDSGEKVRRCLEEFLRFKFANRKGLDANIKDLLQKISNKDAPEEKKKKLNELRNLIHKNFDYLDKFFNENTKHNDGEIYEAENEYLLYQAAILMRYIDKIL